MAFLDWRQGVEASSPDALRDAGASPRYSARNCFAVMGNFYIERTRLTLDAQEQTGRVVDGMAGKLFPCEALVSSNRPPLAFHCNFQRESHEIPIPDRCGLHGRLRSCMVISLSLFSLWREYASTAREDSSELQEAATVAVEALSEARAAEEKAREALLEAREADSEELEAFLEAQEAEEEAKAEAVGDAATENNSELRRYASTYREAASVASGSGFAGAGGCCGTSRRRFSSAGNSFVDAGTGYEGGGKHGASAG